MPVSFLAYCSHTARYHGNQRATFYSIFCYTALIPHQLSYLQSHHHPWLTSHSLPQPGNLLLRYTWPLVLSDIRYLISQCIIIAAKQYCHCHRTTVNGGSRSLMFKVQAGYCFIRLTVIPQALRVWPFLVWLIDIMMWGNSLVCVIFSFQSRILVTYNNGRKTSRKTWIERGIYHHTLRFYRAVILQ